MVYYCASISSMININHFLHIFNDLVRQKYPGNSSSEPSSRDYELADQMFLLFNQLLSSAELLVDHIVTLSLDEYDDSNGDYQQEDTNDISSNVDGIKYSYDTMCAIVEYSKKHTFSSIRRRY